MTQVYNVDPARLNSENDIEQLSEKLYRRFSEKEQSEIARIQQILAFFTSEQCLSQQLAEYFADHQLTQACGYCSVCLGRVAKLPMLKELPSLASFNFSELTTPIRDKLAEQSSSTLISRFLCGLTTPIFTKLRVRKLAGFAQLEHYRFSDVNAWVEQHLR